ncbi:hypothetical protein NXY56_002185 [Leishmania guyanensis]|uniref:Uncharacterized protein n=1 Tax=Leishmania guyanensis TaxID=5670 RepID=A0A1E1ISN3_LEIGU|nr:hypothetical protein, conserved [Leishmania guyanensis]
MSRFPNFRRDSDFRHDEESSKSMSQVQTRPAICLDTSLSFISTASVLAGTTSGPASPLLGPLSCDSVNDVCNSGAAVSSPALFHTRDPNVEASGQHRLQSLKATRSRTISGSRSVHSSSRPYSKQQQSQHQHHHHPLSLSSCSPSVNRDYHAHSRLQRAEQAHCLASEADCSKLEVLESEATVLTRPSDPRPYGTGADGEPGVHSQRVMSATVSPVPRHAVTLSNDFEGVVSIPVSEGAEKYDEEASRGGSSTYAAPTNGSEKSIVDHDARAEDHEDDATSPPRTTPPPRRAFVLSRRCSGTDVEGDALIDNAHPPRPAAEGVERRGSARMLPVDFAADAPRGSTVLVMDNGDEDEECACRNDKSAATIIAHPFAAADAPLAEDPAVLPLTLPVSRLAHGVVMEGTEKDMHRSAAFTARRASAAERDSVSSHRGRLSSAGSSMMSPMPRPVPHSTQTTAASPRLSPARAREGLDEKVVMAVGAVRDDAGDTTKQQQQHWAGTKVTLANDAANASAHATTTTAATAASTTQDLLSFRMHSCILPGSSMLESELQAVPTIPAQLDATTALTTTADDEPASVTPLSSLTMLNSVAGPSLSVTTAAMSSLWLVSGSTPTPLRRLRDRDREVSTTLDVQEGERKEVSKGSDSAPDQTERVLKLVDDASTAAVTTPETRAELHGHVNSSSAPADNSVEAEQPLTSAVDAQRPRRSSAPQYTTARLATSPSIAAPSFSPEPARPQAEAHRPSSPCLTAGTDAPISIQLNPLPSNNDAVAPADPRPLPSPEAATTQHRYCTATPPPFAIAGTHCRLADTASSMSSPSSTESARVSEEVKELVKRAQAEVCRTRESLLSTLRDHRASFHLSEPSPTPKNTTSATVLTVLAQSTAAASTTACVSPSVSPTPTRSLLLPTALVTAAESSTPPSTALTTVSVPTTRTSGDWRSAAVALRPQLRAAADAILRRLQGYDARDHGVLPMETVVRVTYFVITRRQMPPATWSLRTAEGTLAVTPMQASMAASGGGATPRSESAQLSSPNVESCRAALLSGVPLGRQLSSSEAGGPRRCVAAASHRVFETPCQQRFSLSAYDATTRAGVNGSPFSSSRPVGQTRPRDSSELGAAANDEDETARAECHGRPATCISPSRTLEHVMTLQQRRAEEGLYLKFYLTVLEAFKQVFGERYAWRHLGATNASRHDCTITVAQPAQKRRRTNNAPASERSDHRGQAYLTRVEVDAEEVQLEVTNEFNDVREPLETLFPRLRQQYALIQREKRDAAVTPTVSLAANTSDLLTAEPARTEATAAAMGLANRPPPLDVLVYYRTFIESLREL